MSKTTDPKFLLIVSPEISDYLSWNVKNRRMHKAQIVRKAVEEEMEGNKEYQVWLGKYKKAEKKANDLRLHGYDPEIVTKNGDVQIVISSKK